MAVAKVLNIDKVLAHLTNIADTDLTIPLKQSCLLVENKAKELCPVDTGQLRASISSKVDGDTGSIGTNVDYAPYVEYGTGVFAVAGNGRQTPWSYQDAKGDWHYTTGQRPQPYLEPALTQNETQIIDIFRNYLMKELKK